MSSWDRFILIFARVVMILSLGYYAYMLGAGWVGALSGEATHIVDMMELPKGMPNPSNWKIYIGIGVTIFALGSLAVAYWSVHRFLARFSRGELLASDTSSTIRRLALGLVGFWIGYNVIVGAMPLILTLGNAPEQSATFDWNPLDIDIIFLILGITLYAVSVALKHAHDVEEENRHFL